MTRRSLQALVLLLLLGAAGADAASAQDVLSDGPQWPNVRAEDLPDPAPPNPRPPFVTPEMVADRILGVTPQEASMVPASDITGSTARWPSLPPEREPSPFAFEVGSRYWFSIGRISFGFSNGDPLFGTPTSTLDWNQLYAHSGEVFARVDHKPTGLFVKGLAGLGTVFDGEIIDRDFLVGQISFSDTTSTVKEGNLSYAMIDLGWAYSPLPELRIGVFAGYHFWRESVTAFGVRCNGVDFPVNFCGAPGSVVVPFDTAVLVYEPTAHVVRLGFEARYAFADRWSVTTEIAGVPFAAIQNKDSHLLRQSPADLGPAPNVITDTRYAYGVEAQMLFNFAVTPNIEIGAGARYWGLFAVDGGVTFGPAFNVSDTLNTFNMERVGVLVQAKGRF